MPILALHGFTGCGADFAPFARLCGGKWQCPDLPGHGASTALDCSPQSTVEFIQQQSSQLAKISSDGLPNILLGYSMGARAALLHSTLFPDCWDALILISATPGIEDENDRCQRRQSDDKLAASILSQGVPSFLKFWQQTPLIRSQQSIPKQWSSAMQAKRLKHQADGLANSLRQFGQGSVPNLWPELTKLKMPICLLSGQLDTKYTQIAQEMRSISTHPLSVHEVIENASHMPHLEQSQTAAAAISRFLQKITDESTKHH